MKKLLIFISFLLTALTNTIDASELAQETPYLKFLDTSINALSEQAAQATAEYVELEQKVLAAKNRKEALTQQFSALENSRNQALQEKAEAHKAHIQALQFAMTLLLDDKKQKEQYIQEKEEEVAREEIRYRAYWEVYWSARNAAEEAAKKKRLSLIMLTTKITALKIQIDQLAGGTDAPHTTQPATIDRIKTAGSTPTPFLLAGIITDESLAAARKQSLKGIKQCWEHRLTGIQRHQKLIYNCQNCWANAFATNYEPTHYIRYL